ncbi:putative disease resistance protein RGA3 [Magnolia sinica]|uniref:putative disease resistance protein RGA3 n=1 Tax=Magnolia sinica TaxID=86752 RepID=UPI00265A0806|nr:putative disease resistance protein RGA3 [Magnolia sinica]
MAGMEEFPAVLSTTDEPEIFGRTQDVECIVSKLVSEDCPLISIVGIQGIGKTMLAQPVCNNERMKRHFDKMFWVCMSDDLDVTKLTYKIIQSSNWLSNDPYKLDSMRRSLHRCLDGSRFLLVLDDVRNEDDVKWEQLKISLQRGAPESRILATTRRHKAAVVMDSAYIYDLDALSESESVSLFYSNAFVGRGTEVRPELEGIGREIVKKCIGIPLAVKMVGSLALQENRTRLAISLGK